MLLPDWAGRYISVRDKGKGFYLLNSLMIWVLYDQRYGQFFSNTTLKSIQKPEVREIINTNTAEYKTNTVNLLNKLFIDVFFPMFFFESLGGPLSGEFRPYLAKPCYAFLIARNVSNLALTLVYVIKTLLV